MEFVWVIRRRDLFPIAFTHGFCHRADSHPAGRPDELLARIRQHGFFLERRAAEQDPSFKQIIPYCVISTERGCLRLQRLRAQGETRLHDLLSIGVGGHINPIDAANARDPLDAGAHRELEEEIAVAGACELELVGTINDDTTAVGAVHFGVVYRVPADSKTIRVVETEKMAGEVVSAADLMRSYRENPDQYESWSGFLIPRLECVL